MKQGLSLRVSQHLALTPQLQQSIRLLQLSTLELAQEVEQMLDENPFLELNQEEPPRDEGGPPPIETASRDADGDAPGDGGAAADDGGFAERETVSPAESDAPDWDGDGATDMVADDGEWGGDAAPRTGNAAGDEDMEATDLASGDETLQSHLLRQAASLRLSHEDRCALEFLIGSLNEDGYLDEPLEALAQELAGPDLEQREELVHRFTVAMRLLQSLEPAGVGARSLAECLTLQLQAMRAAGAGGTACLTALRICAQPMELLARRDVKRLVQLCGAAEADIKAAMALIVRLEPKPGRRFGNTDRNIVVPDVLVTQIGRAGQPRFRVQLNPDVMPRLRVQEVYATALRSHRGEGHQALQQRLQEARWFIKNIQQRFDTILRVSTAIVERQKNFFVHGELAMRPLVLREIADELGLHESTISRVTTAKYMATPYGTFELKYFFGSALGTETGGNASSTAVRALIRQFVAAENLKKPLSDSQISDMLKEQGIECARRTVAKYREALRIAPASLRKAL